MGAPRRQCISTEITARRGIAHPAAGSVRQSRVRRHAPLGYLPLWDSVDQPGAAAIVSVHMLQHGEREMGKGLPCGRGDRRHAAGVLHDPAQEMLAL